MQVRNRKLEFNEEKIAVCNYFSLKFMMKSISLIIFLLVPVSLFAQTEDETKAFIENIVFHNPSKHQNFYYRFFFKSDRLGFSRNIENCPPQKTDSNASDFMVIERKDVNEGEYSSDYLRISSLRGYKIEFYDGNYYIELQTKGSDGAFFEAACSDISWSSATLSTSSKDDAIKFIKALKHLCNLYNTSFVDLDNLFDSK